MSGQRRAVVLGLWALLGACSVEPAPPPGDPAEPVRAYFDAVARADCERLRASLAGAALERFDASGCQSVLDEHARHGSELLGVHQVRADGRDAKRRLVTVRMRMEGHEREVVLGVQEHPGGFRIDRF